MNRFFKTVIGMVCLVLVCCPAAAMKYNWKYSVLGFITRCFEASQLAVKCEDFSYNEDGKHKIFEELNIEAFDGNGIKRIYGYGKAIEGTLCQEQLHKIKQLLRKVDQACVTGDREFDSSGKETITKFRGFETRRGSLVW